MKISTYLKIIIILLLVVVGSLFFSSLREYLNLISKPFCDEKDIYMVTSWSECSKDGVRTREVKQKNEVSCRIPKEKIPEPEQIESCIYYECKNNDFEIGEWGVCINEKQTRGITKKTDCSISEEDKKLGKYNTEKVCTLGNKKVVSILKNYETSMDVDGKTQANNNNITLKVNGKIKNATLIITGKTQVLGGKPIKIADNYAFWLHMDSDSTPRAIGTSRVGGNLVVNNVPGMFKGLDTPKTLTFDLLDIQLAKSSKEGDGFIKKNFVEILNNYSGGTIEMTLFMAGGGKSMREADPKKRIYAIIESAFIEYECVDDSTCSVNAK